MNRALITCVAFLALPIDALGVDVVSRVAEVTVYPSGAAVTRIAAAELPAGTTILRLPGLVSDIDPQTLRASVDSAGVRLGRVRIGREQQRAAFNAEIERLNDEIRAAETRLAVIDDAIKSAELRLKFLDGLAQGYAKEAWLGGARGSADVASWRQALELLDTGSDDAYAEIRRERERRAEVERDLSVLRRELADLRGGALASSYVEFAVTAERATTAEVRLEYFQRSAFWRPQYEARLDSDAARLSLVQQALVGQQTDEAWTDVALSLSTSDPSGQLEAAEVDSEFLDLAAAVPVAPAAPRAMMKDSGLAAAALEEIAVTAAAVTATLGNFAVTYDIPGRVTVPNDADESQTYDIETLGTDVELVTRVVPRDSERAFLTAGFVYDGDLPLYASAMRVYVDGAYAGMTEMPTALPDAEVLLPMGEDRRVTVRATDRGRERGRTGIVSRYNTEAHSYLFEITNRRSSPTRVEVRDRYPVARNSDIEVDVRRGATPPDETDVDEKPGVVLWRRDVEPGETWRIEHGYTVSYPADKVLTRRQAAGQPRTR